MDDSIIVEMGTSWEFQHGKEREVFCCGNTLKKWDVLIRQRHTIGSETMW